MRSCRLVARHFRTNYAQFALIAFLCVFLSPSLVYGEEKCGSLDRVVSALQVVQAIYPELRQEELDVALGLTTGGPVSYPTDARNVSVTLTADSWHSPEWSKAHPEGSPSATAPVIWGNIQGPLYLRFEFLVEQSQHKWGLACRPGFLNDHASAARRATLTLVETHPEWTDEEILVAAKRAGLRFGPNEKAQLLGSLPLKGLSVVYGPLKVKRAKLLLAQEHEKDAKWSFARLTWEITASEVGSKRILAITVDPFDGRIFGLAEFESDWDW
jgi:hypothetical protein